MHELSIANSLLEIALEKIRDDSSDEVPTRSQIARLNIRIGALSCVHREALRFSFELVARDTPLQGTQLHFTSLPVVLFCPRCQADREIEGIQRFRCPECGTSSGDIRQGKELELESIEFRMA